MTPTDDHVPSPETVVRAVIELATRTIMGEDADQGSVTDIYADPTYVLHPLRPELPPLIHPEDFVRHREAVRKDMPPPEAFRADDIVVHTTTDPEVVVTEFHYMITVAGTTMKMPCIWVTRVRDGRIVEARDYNGEPHPV